MDNVEVVQSIPAEVAKSRYVVIPPVAEASAMVDDIDTIKALFPWSAWHLLGQAEDVSCPHRYLVASLDEQTRKVTHNEDRPTIGHGRIVAPGEE
jgi:hypothetical protein